MTAVSNPRRCGKFLAKIVHGPHRYLVTSEAPGLSLFLECSGWEAQAEPTGWELFFDGFGFKPNFLFEYVYEIDFDVEKLHITMRVPNSRDPEKMTSVGSTHILGRWQGEVYARDWIRWAIRQLENHEIDEWLRFNGELVFDPHKGE